MRIRKHQSGAPTTMQSQSTKNVRNDATTTRRARKKSDRVVQIRYQTPVKQSTKKPKVKTIRKRTNSTLYQIDKLIKKRVLKNGQEEILVSWKGYTAHSNQWIPKRNILGFNNPDVQRMLQDLDLEPVRPPKSVRIKRGRKIKRIRKTRKGYKPGQLIVLESDSDQQAHQSDKQNKKQSQSGLQRHVQQIEIEQSEQEIQKEEGIQHKHGIMLGLMSITQQVETSPVREPVAPVVEASTPQPPQPTPKKKQFNHNHSSYTEEQLRILHKFYETDCNCNMCL